mmetsp:Transcript_95494/g.256719  ORF Transcript_95494/g.256719 Transcript_95494/m.256719 type:complete len:102 (-) Transcript_95494:342-647(-)
MAPWSLWHVRPELEFSDSIDSWNVRSEPRFEAPVSFVLEVGETFEAVCQKGDWVEVRVRSGHHGWSHRLYGETPALAPVAGTSRTTTPTHSGSGSGSGRRS